MTSLLLMELDTAFEGNAVSPSSASQRHLCEVRSAAGARHKRWRVLGPILQELIPLLRSPWWFTPTASGLLKVPLKHDSNLFI